MGAFSPRREQYLCEHCGYGYQFANGILDCMGKDNGDLGESLHQDQLSSFAYFNPAKMDALKARLDPLCNKLLGQTTEARMLLDIGCGFGGLVAVAAARFDFVIGLNINRFELERAAAYFSDHQIQNVLLVRASAQKLPFMPGQFFAVTSVQVLEHVRNPQQAFHEQSQALAPGGALYLSLPNRFTLRREPHTRLYGIGFLPRTLSRWYAARANRLVEFEGVNLLSAPQLSRWLKKEFGSSFKFIRSGAHTSVRGRVAQLVWNIPLLSFIARHLVGDIEVLAWR